MRKLLLCLLLTCMFESLIFSQDLYDFKPFKGYYVSAIYQRKGEWPMSLNFLCSSLDCIYSCKDKPEDNIINNIIDSAYIIPVEYVPNFSLFKYSLKTSDSEILPYVGEYAEMCEALFSQNKIKDHILLKDSTKFDFEYANYYGFILCPRRENDLYQTEIVCGSINYAEYPNIKLAIPIISGFDKWRR